MVELQVTSFRKREQSSKNYAVLEHSDCDAGSIFDLFLKTFVSTKHTQFVIAL